MHYVSSTCHSTYPEVQVAHVVITPQNIRVVGGQTFTLVSIGVQVVARVTARHIQMKSLHISLFGTKIRHTATVVKFGAAAVVFRILISDTRSVMLCLLG